MLPQPDVHSGDRRFFNILKILAQQHIVDLGVVEWGPSNSGEILQAEKNLREIKINLIPSSVSLELVLLKKRYDVVFVEFYYTAESYISTFRYLQPQAKVIVDSIDIHFLREEMGAKLYALDNDIKGLKERKETELAVYKAADAVIVVSDLDNRTILKEIPALRVYLISNIMPMRQRLPMQRQREILFVGGFNHKPNLDGLRWFTENTWPIIHHEYPDATFTIIGSNTPQEVYELMKYPCIRVLGHVSDKDLYSCLDRAMVSIAPLRYGAGIKGKVTEAMASGLPVVATSVGAQGINAVSEVHLLIANDQTEFAGAVIHLLKNPEICLNVGLAGQKLIAGICSPEIAESAIDDMLSSVSAIDKGRLIFVRRWVNVPIFCLKYLLSKIFNFSKSKLRYNS